MLGSQSCFLAILLACILAEAKIVHINGTEISGGDRQSVDGTTAITPPVRYSVFNPQIINNHSGNKTKIEELSLNRRKDAEEEKQTTEDNSSNGTVAIRDTTVLTNLRGVFRDIKPTITVLSTLLGLFLVFILVESPLSPLPVPPLPYPPVGPFPPTNIYPFGIPPIRKPHGIRYAGPPRHDGYRIPRHMEMLNDTVELEKLIEEVMDRVVPHALNDIIDPNKDTLIHEVAIGMKSVLNSLSSMMNKSRQFFQDIFYVHEKDSEKES